MGQEDDRGHVVSTHRAAFARVETKSSCAIQGEWVHNPSAHTDQARRWPSRWRSYPAAPQRIESSIPVVLAFKGWVNMPRLVPSGEKTIHLVSPCAWCCSECQAIFDIWSPRHASPTPEQIDRINRQFVAHCKQVHPNLFPVFGLTRDAL